MNKKCPLCNKMCINCRCDKKICVCGHKLGMHRFVKFAKSTGCLFIFGIDDDGNKILNTGGYEGYCLLVIS